MKPFKAIFECDHLRHCEVCAEQLELHATLLEVAKDVDVPEAELDALRLRAYDTAPVPLPWWRSVTRPLAATVAVFFVGMGGYVAAMLQQAPPASATIIIDGVSGEVTGATGGDVRIRHANGRIQVTTKDGNITVTDSRVAGTVHSNTGDIILTGISGDLKATSQSGHVTKIPKSDPVVPVAYPRER
jgi:hypothetical protein